MGWFIPSTPSVGTACAFGLVSSDSASWRLEKAIFIKKVQALPALERGLLTTCDKSFLYHTPLLVQFTEEPCWEIKAELFIRAELDMGTQKSERGDTLGQNPSLD